MKISIYKECEVPGIGSGTQNSLYGIHDDGDGSNNDEDHNLFIDTDG